jgi:phospholipid/cholesterol/gamma-HCH transport system ATP-binding protein
VETPLIEFRNVSKRFGDRTILDNVNAKIFKGDVTTIIGKSGGGKSVFLKHIIGLLSPTEGNILFRGRSVDEMSSREWEAFRSQFSYCFQNNALFDSLTVFENIALPLQQTTKLSKQEIAAKVMEKVDQLDLSEVPHKYPSEISGGMQKRVALARALVTDPSIVFFDEPSTGQDPIRKNAILSMIAQNQKKFGFTTIMISHDVPDVFFISDRILVLYEKQIVFQGTYHELDQFEHPMVDEFVKSLEGIWDELTGLRSKNSFMKLYEDVKDKARHESIIVATFALDDTDRLSEELGYTQVQGLMQGLGECVNRHFGDAGISTRIGRNQIATILQCSDLSKAELVLDDFARKLQDKELGDIEGDGHTGTDSLRVHSFSVSVGLAEANASEDIQVAAKRAGSRTKKVMVSMLKGSSKP